MYQLMLFKDMVPEYVSPTSNTESEGIRQFQICNINGEVPSITIRINEGQNPETIALEALGYFVVPEAHFAASNK